MPKYTVEGVIKLKVTVEADSEDEALENAEMDFDLDSVEIDNIEPEWQTATEIEPSLEDEDGFEAASDFDDED